MFILRSKSVSVNELFSFLRRSNNRRTEREKKQQRIASLRSVCARKRIDIYHILLFFLSYRTVFCSFSPAQKKKIERIYNKTHPFVFLSFTFRVELFQGEEKCYEFVEVYLESRHHK